MKICSGCKLEKNDGDFWVRKNRKSGLASRCFECESIIRKKKRENNPEHFTKLRKEYYDNNKNKFKKYNSLYQKENRERVNEYHRKWWTENGERYSLRRKELRADITYEQKNVIRMRAKENMQSYRMRNPEKCTARQELFLAIRRGDMVRPKNCQICENENKLEAHHYDYSKPLDVFWSCKKCHAKIHRLMK